ncbi:MAG: LON peptidase substrate-binding domain-containing protein, partial [candidate division Zixibacteria bacterium]|nr:LON peptidase substrate-binding domain-containing protein [candidate division Zixibacteria bacterium]
MIIKSITKTPLQPTDELAVYPILPVKVGLLFPGHRRRYHINRPSSLKLLEHVCRKKCLLALSYSPTPRELADGGTIPLSEVGVTARVVSVKDARNETKDVEFEGIDRIALTSIVERDPFLRGRISGIEQRQQMTHGKRERLISAVIDVCEKIIDRGSGIDARLRDIVRARYKTDGEFADAVASGAPLGPAERQALLEAIDIKDRLELLFDLLKLELDRVQLSIQLGNQAKKEMEEKRRREFLEFKLEEIKQQLGGSYAEEKASTALKRRINLATHLPPDVREIAREEAARLAILPIGAAEYASVKHFVETLLSLPWTQPETKSDSDESVVEKLKETIFKDYYGSDSIKEKIVDRISSNILAGGSEKGPIICLVGPPGTGKATIARAVARGLGREFVRISLGAVVDLNEVKGSNRYLIAAAPGVFIKALQRLKSPDPVIYVEDMEYFSEGSDSALALALLEIMDPRLNSRFVDNYLGIPFDFSNALFICGVRYPDGIPEAIDHRTEAIEIPGYIENEKISIAKKYLIPALLKRYKLTRSEVTITNDTLTKLIRDYTMESGLLEYSRLLDRLYRHIASGKRSSKRKTWQLDSALVETFMGPPIFIPEKPVKEPEIGLATGLAWTGAGGELMLIECLKMRGDGNIVFTGSLGDVMKESIQAAHSYIRSKSDMLGIDNDDFKSFDIHVHFPSGAIPKDGPSAGLAVSLVIASVMAERPIRNDLAMTGEVTLRGKVLPVGGIKEKIAAAYRANIPYVCMPLENEKDLKDLPSEITRNTKFIFVGSVDELFEQALLDFTPSTHT